MLQHPFKIVLLALPLLGGAEAKAGSCLNIQAPEGPYGIQLQGSLVGGGNPTRPWVLPLSIKQRSPSI